MSDTKKEFNLESEILKIGVDHGLPAITTIIKYEEIYSFVLQNYSIRKDREYQHIALIRLNNWAKAYNKEVKY